MKSVVHFGDEKIKETYEQLKSSKFEDNTDSLSDSISSPNLRSEERSIMARQYSQRVCGITNSSSI